VTLGGDGLGVEMTEGKQAIIAATVYRAVVNNESIAAGEEHDPCYSLIENAPCPTRGPEVQAQPTLNKSESVNDAYIIYITNSEMVVSYLVSTTAETAESRKKKNLY
jgi:hypothetical protein